MKIANVQYFTNIKRSLGPSYYECEVRLVSKSGLDVWFTCLKDGECVVEIYTEPSSFDLLLSESYPSADEAFEAVERWCDENGYRF